MYIWSLGPLGLWRFPCTTASTRRHLSAVLGPGRFGVCANFRRRLWTECTEWTNLSAKHITCTTSMTCSFNERHPFGFLGSGWSVMIWMIWISKSRAMRVYRHLTRRPLHVLLTSIFDGFHALSSKQPIHDLPEQYVFVKKSSTKIEVLSIKLNLVPSVNIGFGSPWVEVFSKQFAQHTYTSLLLNLCHPPIPENLPSCP